MFPGNTSGSFESSFSNEQGIAQANGTITFVQPQTLQKVRNLFMARMTPFNRAKEALVLVEQELESLKEEELSQLKQTLESLEQSLALIKAKL